MSQAELFYPEIVVLEDERFGMTILKAVQQRINEIWVSSGRQIPSTVHSTVVIRPRDMVRLAEQLSFPGEDGTRHTAIAAASIDQNVFGGTGIEAAVELKERFPNVILFLLSGNLVGVRSHRLYREGLFDQEVSKPVQVSAYADMMVRALQRAGRLPAPASGS